jgi:hypothetical protein
MKRLAFTSAALLCCLSLSTAAFAQTSKSAAKAPVKTDATPAVSTAPAPVSPELMKARMRPPVKGTATVDYIVGPTKLVKDEWITPIKVKNTSSGPIVGFRIDQYFYRVKEEVSAGTGRLRNPIAPGEIADVTISAPMKPGVTGNTMRFAHQNGSVQPTAVKKFTDDAAAKKK